MLESAASRSPSARCRACARPGVERGRRRHRAPRRSALRAARRPAHRRALQRRATRSTATSTRCGARATSCARLLHRQLATCCSRTRSRARLVAATGSAVLCASDHGVDAESMKAVAARRAARAAQQGRARRAAPRVHRPGPDRSRRTARCWPRSWTSSCSAGRSTSTTRTRSRSSPREVPVRLVPVDGLAWIEIDDHDDLAQRPRRGAGARRVRADGPRRPAPRRHGLAVWRRYMELPRYLRAVQRARRAGARCSASWPPSSASTRLAVVSGADVHGARSARDLAAALRRAPASPLGVEANTEAEVERARRGARAARGRTRSWRSAAARRSTSPSPPARVAELPLIVVPTQLTADGIASPVSVIRDADGRLRQRPRPPADRGRRRPGRGRRRRPPERTRAGPRRPARQPLRAARLAPRGRGRAARRWTTSRRCCRRARPTSSTPPTPVALGGGTPAARVPAPPAARPRAERPRDGDRRLVAAVLRLGAPDQPRARRRCIPAPRSTASRWRSARCSRTRLQGGDWRRAARLHAGRRAWHDAAARVRPARPSELAAVVRAAPAMRPERHTVLNETESHGRRQSPARWTTCSATSL